MCPLKYLCIMKTVSLWTAVCFSKRKVPFFCLEVFVSVSWPFYDFSFSLCSVPSSISCLFSPFLSPIPPSFSAFIPSTPSVSFSVFQACLSPSHSLSWTHVGLIELEDPGLIKARVRLNASKPPRLQTRTGK